MADLFIRIPVKTKLGLADEIASIQPMSTLFEQSLFLLGDILCMEIAKKKGVADGDLWALHANLE